MCCLCGFTCHVSTVTCHISLTPTATAMDPPSANSPTSSAKMRKATTLGGQLRLLRGAPLPIGALRPVAKTTDNSSRELSGHATRAFCDVIPMTQHFVVNYDHADSGALFQSLHCHQTQHPAALNKRDNRSLLFQTLYLPPSGCVFTTGPTSLLSHSAAFKDAAMP